MSEHYHVNRYIIEFNRYATLLTWDDTSLLHHFYTGLANHIKDSMVQTGRLTTLVTMIYLAQ